MRDILPDLERWRNENRPIALATVVETWGSSPRRVGSKMGMTLDGRITGSVSGGCVENAVVEAGIESVQTDRPRLLHYGVADETAWEVGLACGGSIDVFVKPLDPEFYERLHSTLMEEAPAVHVTVIRGPEPMLGREVLLRDAELIGSLGNEWDEKVLNLARQALRRGSSQRLQLDEDVEVFAEVILPPPTLIVVGGVHIAIALVSLAKMLGYRTVLIDPREAWSSEERFPHVDQLIRAWPEEAFQGVQLTRSTAIAMLTHDPKLDDPALKIALSSPASYIGALGSKSTHAKRRERLLKAGLTDAQLERLNAPIGLDIGAETPEEIALAIMAEVVKAHRRQEQIPAEHEADLHQAS